MDDVIPENTTLLNHVIQLFVVVFILTLTFTYLSHILQVRHVPH